MIPIAKPLVGDEEQREVARVLSSGLLAQGPEVEAFEREFAAFCGTRHALATTNGTTALHLSLLAAGVGPGDEVITTPFSFFASASSIRMAGAKPVFVDLERDGYTLDPAAVVAAITPRTKAVMPVHLYGELCDMDALREACDTVPIIEDACQAHGADAGGRAGSHGLAGCFSFYPTKNMTTGEGGMLVTDDESIAQRVRKLRWCGITSPTWERFKVDHVQRGWMYDVEEVGWKYEMNDLAAALGLAQMDRLEACNERRRELMIRYREAFDDVDDIDMLAARDYAVSSCYNAVVRLDDREGLYAHLDASGIDSNVHFYPNHLFRIFRPYTTHLPVAEREWQRILSIPLHPELTDGEQDRVIDAVRTFAQGESRKSVVAG